MQAAIASFFFPLAFLNLWGTVIVGAAAVAVPIIIHLLNRRRFRVVVWAAMRFLLNAQKQNTRRLRLEQFLLLPRRAVVLLVVLAMATITPPAAALLASLLPPGGDEAGRRRTSVQHSLVI